MTEQEIEQEIESEEKQAKQVNEKIIKLTEFLVDVGLDYKLETWDSGEGREVIIEGKDEDEQEDCNQTKKYNIKFVFYNSGYVELSVEEFKQELLKIIGETK